MEENRNKTAELGTFWADNAEGNTPLSAANLNARETKIKEEMDKSGAIVKGEGENNAQQPNEIKNEAPLLSWSPDNPKIKECINEEKENHLGKKIQTTEDKEILIGTYGKNSIMTNGKSQTLGGKSHAEGSKTIAFGNGSHSEGNESLAAGNYSHTEGNITTALGDASHAEGVETYVEGIGGHAEGYKTEVLKDGVHGHAEGCETIVNNYGAHAEGERTIASGAIAHSEGQKTEAIGNASHAEGTETIAEGDYSHAEGSETKALGTSSHSEGQNTTARGHFSHAGGHANTATGFCETVIGRFGAHKPFVLETTETYLFRIGNGRSEDTRGNAMTVDWDGNLKIAGELQDMNGNNLLGSSGGNTMTPIIFTWYLEYNSPSTMTYIIPRGTKWSEMATVCPEFWNDKGCYITPDGYIGWSLTTYICTYGNPNNRILPTDEVKQGVIYTSSEQQYN